MKNGLTTYVLFFSLVLFTKVTSAANMQQWQDVSSVVLSEKINSLNKTLVNLHEYSVSITDESYASYTSVIYHQRLTGYFKRSENGFHSYLGGMHTIQNKQCRVAVDSVKKIIMLADPSDFLGQVMSADDYSQRLKSCEKMMVSHSNNLTTYRFEYKKGSPIAAYELTLKDSLPQKIVIYYSKAVKGNSENNLDKPRLEVHFDNWFVNKVQPKEEFNIDKYVLKQGNKYVLKPPFSVSYKLLDQRVLTRNDKK